MDKLYNSIIELGKGRRWKYPVFYCHRLDQISRIFWLLHSDLHEARVTAVLEYLSSMVASLEPSHQLANGQRGHLENFSLIKHNSKKGKFHVRFKKRNGRQRKFTLTVSHYLYIFAI
ncbi:hypothetical protein ES332_A09G000500v1 [Gossypium tomentosum]|uniref:Elongator complex protein 5 n=1 Tax=Gossypium tomentosum TaxID=34277 RepID=A0A5D2NZ93_GOSTO|nr:hypothetical protein ES332_A09G000500v1 [Gossypium tomentosum]